MPGKNEEKQPHGAQRLRESEALADFFEAAALEFEDDDYLSYTKFGAAAEHYVTWPHGALVRATPALGSPVVGKLMGTATVVGVARTTLRRVGAGTVRVRVCTVSRPGEEQSVSAPAVTDGWVTEGVLLRRSDAGTLSGTNSTQQEQAVFPEDLIEFAESSVRQTQARWFTLRTPEDVIVDPRGEVGGQPHAAARLKRGAWVRAHVGATMSLEELELDFPLRGRVSASALEPRSLSEMHAASEHAACEREVGALDGGR